MKTHFFYVSLQLALLTTILGSACTVRLQNEASVTQEPAETIPTIATPTPPPTKSPIPTLRYYGMETPVGTPYPLARVIQGNVVAFIVEDDISPPTFSLWVANLDGSGEKRLVQNIDNSQASPYRRDALLSLQWAPDAKWISYTANDALWLISPDGSIVRELLSLPDKSKGILFSWIWSPDSSRIVYVQTPGQDANPRHASLGIVDVPSGQLHKLPDHTFGYSVGVSWAPDGGSLWLTGIDSLSLMDAESASVLRVFSSKQYPGCTPDYFDSQTWSPNGEWTAFTNHGTGSGLTWFCTLGMNGGSPRSQGRVTSGPFWDHTGNILYYGAVISLGNSIRAGTEQVIMRLDVRTDQAERLFTLERDPEGYTGRGCAWILSLPPDTHLLEAHCRSPQASSLTILNLKRYSTVTYGLDTKLGATFELMSNPVAWASDSQNLVILREGSHPPSDMSFDLPWPYLIFYSLNVATGKTTVVSGWHKNITEWAVSPNPVSP